MRESPRELCDDLISADNRHCLGGRVCYLFADYGRHCLKHDPRFAIGNMIKGLGKYVMSR